MNAAPHAPLASHPIQLAVRVTMKAPRPDGLRSREESGALFALEDALVSALVTRGFLFVAGDYTLEMELELEEDPEWSAYSDWLYPPELQGHLMSNQNLLEVLAKQGDRSEVARGVDHLAYSPDPDKASRAAAQLAKQGFKVAPVRAPEPPAMQWGLPFTREDSLAEGRADAVTVEILEALQAHEGDYGGRGCTTVTT